MKISLKFNTSICIRSTDLGHITSNLQAHIYREQISANPSWAMER